MLEHEKTLTDLNRERSIEADYDNEREMNELLQELRVALPGSQVLFAFLLALPFTDHFSSLSSLQELLYVTTLLLAACSVALFIMPSAHHRVLFRKQAKEPIVCIANKLAIAGMVFLALAMANSLVLIISVIYKDTLAFFVGGAMFIIVMLIWFWYPLRLRLKGFDNDN